MINLRKTRDTVRFRFIQILSKSNNSMSSIVVLCCKKISYLG
jgi:hypothetical protein